MESKLHRRIRVWIDHNQTKFYVILGVILAIIVGVILFLLLHEKEEPYVPPAQPKEEVVPRVVTVTEETPREIPEYIPESRDQYFHIESVPGDGLYEQIQECEPMLSESVDVDIVANLVSYIQTLRECELEPLFIFKTSSDTAYTYWIQFDDFYWRLKYYKESKKITADGELKDFWYEPFDNWDTIYQDLPEELWEINNTVAASMVAKIMEQYPYDTYLRSEGPWFWDQDDANNYSLYSETYVLQNKAFTDTWVLEYKVGEYMCMYRKIAETTYTTLVPDDEDSTTENSTESSSEDIQTESTGENTNEDQTN